MNTQRDLYYYYTLGLQPGASSSEIKSAFRRLVKLYHADKDHSLDAEMKYKEIQAAYKELLKRLSVNQAGSGINSSRHTTGTSEASRERRAERGQGYTSSKQAEWNPKGWIIKDDLADKRISLKKPILMMLGSIPLLEIDTLGYMIIGAILIIVAFFLSFHLEKSPLFLGTGGRMAFWFPCTISLGLCLFVYSWPLIYYLLLFILCILGLITPAHILMTRNGEFFRRG